MVDTKVPTIIFMYRFGGGIMRQEYTIRSKEEKLTIDYFIR